MIIRLKNIFIKLKITKLGLVLVTYDVLKIVKLLSGHMLASRDPDSTRECLGNIPITCERVAQLHTSTS